MLVAVAGLVVWRRRFRCKKSKLSTLPSTVHACDSAVQRTNVDLQDCKVLTSCASTSHQQRFSTQTSAEEKEGKISSAVAVGPAWSNIVPFSDWEIDVSDVVICVRPNGRKWELGAGAFSRVSNSNCKRRALSWCFCLLAATICGTCGCPCQQGIVVYVYATLCIPSRCHPPYRLCGGGHPDAACPQDMIQIV